LAGFGCDLWLKQVGQCDQLFVGDSGCDLANGSIAVGLGVSNREQKRPQKAGPSTLAPLGAGDDQINRLNVGFALEPVFAALARRVGRLGVFEHDSLVASRKRRRLEVGNLVGIVGHQ